MTLIAANFGVSVEDILAINNLANGDLLQVGQELIIPGGSGDTIATAFTVGVGDTLAGLAAGFNTTVDAIVASNRLISADPPLRIGQSIPLISRTGSATIRPVTGRPYLVRPGDTLLLVAASHGLTPAQLAAENGLNARAYLFPGQRLKIPDETTPYRFLPEGWVDIRLNSSAVTQGSTLVIYAQNMLAGTPAGRFGDQPLHFAQHENGYVALVGVDAISEPGERLLELTGGDERNLWQPVRAQIPLLAASYPTQTIQVDDSLSPLLDPAIRAAEDELLGTMFAVFEEPRRWEGVFQVPVTTTVVSAGYGGLRSYNGGPLEVYHTGTDFAASQGDIVSAPAAGTVVFSGETQLRGNVVIIDHGRGVMSGLYHLEESFVETGQTVSLGQQVGRVGSTGLSSGPHLHWDLRVMGVPVDPLPWTQQAFP